MNCINDNITEAIRALREKPVFSTSFERVELFSEIYARLDKSAPQPLNFSAFLGEFLGRVSTPVSGKDIILGRMTDRELTADEERFFQAFKRGESNPYGKVVYGTGHCTYDWENLIKRGLTGLIEDISAALKSANEQQSVFLEGARGALKAIISYAHRYADAAEKEGLSEAAGVMRAIATGAPRSFYEGLQLCWLVTLIATAYIGHNPTLNCGRLDQILYPLYERDINSGVLTKERAAQIITDYYCKHNLTMGRGEHQLGTERDSTTFSRILNFDAPQYLPIAGRDDDGNDAVNALTELFADCIVEGFKNPVVVVRYYEGMNAAHPSLCKTLAKKAFNSCSLMFYNDDDIYSALRSYGLPERDARRYDHFGCNWGSVGHDSAWMGTGPHAHLIQGDYTDEERAQSRKPFMRCKSDGGWPQVLNEILYGLEGREGVTYEDIYAELLEQIRQYAEAKIEYVLSEKRLRERHGSNALTIEDLFSRRAISEGRGVNTGAAKYFFQIHSIYGMATVVDSLTAIKTLVFDHHRLSLQRLIAALKADFIGYERERALCKNADKLGSGGEESTLIAARFTDDFARIATAKNAEYIRKHGVFLGANIQSDTRHITMGYLCGATADGRRAGEPLSQNSAPSQGAAKNGLTAMLSSLMRLRFDRYMSGAFNLDINKRDFEGDGGEERFAALLYTYLNGGGLHAQVSALSADRLREARLNPDDHRDIMVRVTGYSGIFVDMNDTAQDDIIRRYEK